MYLLGTENGWWRRWRRFPTTRREKLHISVLLELLEGEVLPIKPLVRCGFWRKHSGKTNNVGGGSNLDDFWMTSRQPQTSPSRVRWGGFSWAVDLGTLSRSRQFSYHWCVLPKYISPLLCRLCFSFCTQNIITFLRTKWTKDKVSILYVCVCGVPRKYS